MQQARTQRTGFHTEASGCCVVSDGDVTDITLKGFQSGLLQRPVVAEWSVTDTVLPEWVPVRSATKAYCRRVVSFHGA